MKTLINILAAGASVLALVSCAAPQEKATAAPSISAQQSTDDAQKTIEQFEHDWVQAIVAKDTAAIDRLIADDFVGTTNDQTYSKADAIDDVKTGNHEALDISDVDVRVFGDAAVATMRQDEKSHHGEDDFSGRYLFTNVWVKRNGEWRAVASHGSRVR